MSRSGVAWAAPVFVVGTPFALIPQGSVVPPGLVFTSLAQPADARRAIEVMASALVRALTVPSRYAMAG
ncbi:peptidase [Mycobacteroides franklinii]|nr:peptidase [Mycobacteroides franklinii]